MTRWKIAAETTIIRTMLEHHQYGRYHAALLTAAESAGLPLASANRRYQTCGGDIAWERVWYVPTEALARVGGLKALDAAAMAAMAEREA